MFILNRDLKFPKITNFIKIKLILTAQGEILEKKKDDDLKSRCETVV